MEERLRRTMMFVPGNNAGMVKGCWYLWLPTPLCLTWKIQFQWQKRCCSDVSLSSSSNTRLW